MNAVVQPLARPGSLGELFVAFTLLALQGFGGVLAVSQRMLCEQKRWLTQEEFVELLATSHVLPGPNVCNLALLVGDRFFGWRGAFTALAGMFVLPIVIVLAMTVLYAQYALHPAVAGAVKGMAAVTAGLFIGTGLSLAKTLKDNAMRVPACALVGVATFGAVALMHWPAWISLVIGALGSVYAWYRIGAASLAETASSAVHPSTPLRAVHPERSRSSFDSASLRSGRTDERRSRRAQDERKAASTPLRAVHPERSRSSFDSASLRSGRTDERRSRRAQDERKATQHDAQDERS